MATVFPNFVDLPEGEEPQPGIHVPADAAYLNSVNGAVNILENAMPAKADSDGLAVVATSGAYTDLIGPPFIPNSPDDIGAQPAGTYVVPGDLAAVATSGDYTDLTGKPTIPSTPADVGLGNVQNLAPADLPISTATQGALDTINDAGVALGARVDSVEIRADSQDGISNIGDATGSIAITPGGGNGVAKLMTLNQNCFITFNTGSPTGRIKALELILTQGGAGGFEALWVSTIRWEAGTPPTLSIEPGAVDRLIFTSYDDGVTWYGDVVGLGYA